jgi:hypothetical protein
VIEVDSDASTQELSDADEPVKMEDDKKESKKGEEKGDDDSEGDEGESADRRVPLESESLFPKELEGHWPAPRSLNPRDLVVWLFDQLKQVRDDLNQHIELGHTSGAMINLNTASRHVFRVEPAHTTFAFSWRNVPRPTPLSWDVICNNPETLQELQLRFIEHDLVLTDLKTASDVLQKSASVSSPSNSNDSSKQEESTPVKMDTGAGESKKEADAADEEGGEKTEKKKKPRKKKPTAPPLGGSIGKKRKRTPDMEVAASYGTIQRGSNLPRRRFAITTGNRRRKIGGGE